MSGGTVKDDENLEQAFEREVMEEIGLTIKTSKPIFIFNINNQDRLTLQNFYSAEYVSSDVRLDPTEHDAFE